MANRLAEAWLSSNGAIVAVRAKGGGWMYFTTTGISINGEAMEDNPVIAREIAKMSLEMVEAKNSTSLRKR